MPFLHQGRTRRGVDCVGLVIVVLQELKLFDRSYDNRSYGRLPTCGLLDQEMDRALLRADRAAPGAVVGVRWSTELAHVAICTGETIVHAYEKRGLVVEHGYRGAWVQRTCGIWTHPGIEP